MSGFQTYLDNTERKAGLTAWLQTEHGLGHGHAANLAQLVVNGREAVEAKHGPLLLDGLTAR
jgi:hypothetical protein